MKLSSKILIAVLALLLMTVFTGSAFADVIVTATEDAATEAPATEAPAATESTGVNSNYTVGMTVTDSEGNPVQSGGFLSCLSAGASFYINHGYIITARYYDSNGKAYDTSDRLILGVVTDSDYVHVDGNVITLDPAPSPYVFTIRIADAKSDSGEITYPLDVKQIKIEFADILLLAVAAYVLVEAIRGKGSLFKEDFIKEDKLDQFRKLMRLVCFVVAIVLIAAAVLSIFFSYIDGMTTVRYVLFGIGLAGLISMVVINNVFTDKEKRAKAFQGGGSGTPTNSSAAFEFDGTEPTLDEVLADIEKDKGESSDNN